MVNAAPCPGLEITEDFARALALLHSGSHLFLTGKAGTGKSTLIRHFMATTTRRTVVAAPTGVAALNVNGYTLHRLFSWGPEVTAEDIAAGDYYPHRFAEVLRTLDTLIIDEASMVRADIFDCLATALQMYGPKRGTPFGGVQLVLVGDLYQLPPVVGPELAEYFASVYPTPYFFSARHFDRRHFPVIELTKVFRQVGDHQLIDLLNAIRDGRMSRAVQDALNERVCRDFQPPDGEFWLTLATVNYIVHARNAERLRALPGPEFSYDAQVLGELDGYRAQAPRTLRFKLGAQVMMLTNDEADRWVNGTLGTVEEVVDRGDPFPTVWIRMRDGSLAEVDAHRWDITRPQVSAGTLTHQAVGAYTQLPFTLAWAITIHKAQGQTLERALIDLTGSAFATGQLYVALSRCTSLDGMVLKRPITARDVKIDHRVRQFLIDSHDGAASSANPTEGQSEPGISVIEALLVGQGDGFIRPLELAVAGPDGTITTSLINPRRDIGDAGPRLGISADLLQVAPTLSQAWPVFEKTLDGTAVASSLGADFARILDVELKRTGKVCALYDIASPATPASPAGAEHTGSRPPHGRPSGGHPNRHGDTDARARAQFLRSDLHHVLAGDSPALRHASTHSASDSAAATRRAIESGGIDAPVPPYHPLDEPEGGFLLTRSGRIIPAGDPQRTADTLSEILAGQITCAQAEDSVCQFEREYGVHVQRDSAALRPPLEEIMAQVDGMCFTGTVYEDGRYWEYEDLAELAERCGLRAYPTLTRKRCDLLIAASLASQSGKMRNATRWEIPIYSAAEFLAWARAQLHQ